MQNYTLHTYFGDATDSIPQDYHLPAARSTLQNIIDRLKVPSLVCAEQQHTTDVLIVTQATPGIKVGPEENDIVMTNLPNIAVGVFTGDCLPILLYDPVHHAVAAIHAGWRGTVALVTQKAVESMQSTYGTKPEELKVFIGPCAKLCCYEVGTELIEAVNKTLYARLSLFEWDDKVCFDIVQFNLQVLLGLGVPLRSIQRTQNVCTICTPQYCSHRRQKEKAGRQINLIWMAR